MISFREKLVTNERTDERTDGRTNERQQIYRTNLKVGGSNKNCLMDSKTDRHLELVTQRPTDNRGSKRVFGLVKLEPLDLFDINAVLGTKISAYMGLLVPGVFIFVVKKIKMIKMDQPLKWGWGCEL